jgi:hypothetical protein
MANVGGLPTLIKVNNFNHPNIPPHG